MRNEIDDKIEKMLQRHDELEAEYVECEDGSTRQQEIRGELDELSQLEAQLLPQWLADKRTSYEPDLKLITGAKSRLRQQGLEGC